MSKLTKTGLKNASDLHAFIEKHCSLSNYVMTFSKCDPNVQCRHCRPPLLPLDVFRSLVSNGFPLPVPSTGRPGHYQKFSEVYGSIPDPTHMPSNAVKGRGGHLANSQAATMLTHQKARTFVRCEECTKPRIIFAAKQGTLSGANSLLLQDALDHVRYTCGSFLIVKGAPIETAWQRAFTDKDGALIYVRDGLRCIDPVEVGCYSLGAKLGLDHSPCCWCGSDVTEENGLNEFLEHARASPGLSFSTICSSSACKRLGFISRKAGKANQVSVAAAKRAVKKAAGVIKKRNRLLISLDEEDEDEEDQEDPIDD